MHICIINHYAVPTSEAGGTRHFSLGRALVARGHRVTIIASAFRHARSSSQSSNSDAVRRIDGVDFAQLTTPAYTGNGAGRIVNMLTFAWRVLSLARNGGLGAPDVILGSSPHPFAAVAARRIARNRHVPFILEVRDLWPASLIKVGGLSPRHPLVVFLGRIERSLYKSADAIVSLLPNALGYIAARGGEPERITWIPNGVDLSLVGDATPPTPSTTRPFTVMYTGTMGRANAMDSLLDAACELQAMLPDVRFRFIGEGPERERLEKRAMREGLTNVSFEEPVAKRDLFDTLRQADLFLVSTRKLDLYAYGLSLNKLFDYLAVGRPVVFGADCPGNPVLDADAGLVVGPEDGKELAGAILKVHAMTDRERNEMGLRGRQFVEQHHDIEKLAAQLERVCQLATRRA